jgi:TetR/AcrR family transcriptional repressor of nem operon
MARNKEFDEKQVLEAAMKTFWQKGYSATSMQDLEKAMHLKRSSIYNAFGDKRSIFKKSIALYIENIQGLLTTIFKSASSGKEAVLNWLNTILDIQFSKDAPDGCLVILSVLESQQHDQETIDMVNGLFQTERIAIYEKLQEGMQNGEFSQKFDAAGVAATITATASGLVILATAKFPITMLYGAIQTVMNLLDE